MSVDPRPPIAAGFAALSAAATVTRPDDVAAITTRVILLPERQTAVGDDLRVISTIKVIALRRDQVPTAPQGTLIQVTEGPDTGVYSVDAVELLTAEEIRVAVVRLS